MCGNPHFPPLIRSVIASAIAVYALACCIPQMAEAASVYGTALAPDGKPIVRLAFEVLNAKGDVVRTVSTDESGRYSVFLKPGIYPIRLGPDWVATIQSMNDPIIQNLQFRVRKREG